MSWASGRVVRLPDAAITRKGELPEVRRRVDRNAVDPQLEVKMGSRARAGAPGAADRLALGQPLAGNHVNGAQMGLEHRAAPRIDEDDVPSRGSARSRDAAARGGPDAEAAEDADVDSEVGPTPARAVAVGDGPVCRQLQRQRLEMVEVHVPRPVEDGGGA